MNNKGEKALKIQNYQYWINLSWLCVQFLPMFIRKFRKIRSLDLQGMWKVNLQNKIEQTSFLRNIYNLLTVCILDGSWYGKMWSEHNILIQEWKHINSNSRMLSVVFSLDMMNCIQRHNTIFIFLNIFASFAFYGLYFSYMPQFSMI